MMRSGAGLAPERTRTFVTKPGPGTRCVLSMVVPGCQAVQVVMAGRLTLVVTRTELERPARLAAERLAAGRRREGHGRALVALRLSVGERGEERDGRNDDHGRARE